MSQSILTQYRKLASLKARKLEREASLQTLTGLDKY